MANYYGSARSNYFKVTDIEKFREAVEKFDVSIVSRDDNKDSKDLDSDTEIALLSNDEGGWNWYDSDEDDYVYAVDVIAPFLATGYVCILMEAGAEKLRYISGSALAFNNKRVEVGISLSDIYKLAEEKFEVGAIITEATY